MTLFRLLATVVLLAAPSAAAQRSAPHGPKAAQAVPRTAAAVQPIPAPVPAALPGPVPESARLQPAVNVPSAGDGPRALDQAIQADGANDAVFDSSARAPRDEAAEVYLEANPGSRTVEVLGAVSRVPFRVVAARMQIDNVFTQHHPGKYELGAMLPPYAPAAVFRAVQELLGFADRAASEPAAARFVELTAETAALDMLGDAPASRRHTMPANPLPSGEYWDLATGPNGVFLMIGAESPNTRYTFFDLSPFSVAVLNHAKRMLAAVGVPTAHVEVMRADVRQLARPPTALAVIRAKNVHTYAEGSETDIERMADWIAEGGQLILENDPSGAQRENTVGKLGPMIERLLAKGWTLCFGGFARRRAELETLTLTRRSAAGPDDASLRVWRDYKRHVSDRVRRASDPADLFRLLFGR